MRMLENAQTAPAEIQPKPLSWNDSDPEGQIKLHEPCAAPSGLYLMYCFSNASAVQELS